MDHETRSRRAVLEGVLSLAAGATFAPYLFPCPAAARGHRLMPTPAQTEGPYYPQSIPDDADSDLLHFAGRGAPDGTPALVSGRVLDMSGRPIAGARVEIWQCDAHGRYHYVAEQGPRPRDPNFQGFGRVVTDAQGRYAFRTIRPVAYAGRTPHIHYNVVTRGHRRLVTQLYVEGEPRNDRDFVLQGIRNAEARASVIRPFRPAPDAGLGLEGVAADFDIVLG